jgi:hypothetical protein
MVVDIPSNGQACRLQPLGSTPQSHLVPGREPKVGVRLAAWIAAGFLLVCLPIANQ